MNFKLKNIPERTARPRSYGLTMVMDKGLSIREAEDMISGSGPYIDILKLVVDLTPVRGSELRGAEGPWLRPWQRLNRTA